MAEHDDMATTCMLELLYRHDLFSKPLCGVIYKGEREGMKRSKVKGIIRANQRGVVMAAMV